MAEKRGVDSPDADDRQALGWRTWLSALGPGTIVASLTIGTGELVFSTRAGALFGYRALGIFAAVLVLKWALVYASARYWVAAEEHPLRRWANLPGPRGWLPILLLLVAVPAFPVWVSFHSGTIGTLLASLTGTEGALGGAAPLAWGVVVLLGVMALSATGGYARQEKFQAVVVAAMLASVIVALLRLNPDWGAMASGFGSFGRLQYPDWARTMPAFVDRPEWVEAATYAGVVGGSGFDYLAYVAWLRDKYGEGSGRRHPAHALRRLVLADSVLSFLMVLAFSGVFVACGSMLLAPREQVPTGSDLLTLQAQFVAVVGPWLKPLYFCGALLALVGTLYGTLEVAPAVLREIGAALGGPGVPSDAPRFRRWAVGWSACGALGILLVTLAWRGVTGAREPFDLVALVTPANLLTGVLACGWISLLNLGLVRHAGDPRAAWLLAGLNAVGAAAFSIIGLRAAWEQARWTSLLILAGALALAVAIATFREGRAAASSARVQG